MNKWIWVVVVFFVVIAITRVVIGGPSESTSAKRRDLRRKRPLTEREQSMYFRLCMTFPQHVVLSQVAFSALLVSKQQATRNGYNRKVADFVLCTKAFDVLAVIELDDSSHKGREEADGDRDAWLKDVGFRVVRYPQIPDAAKLLADFPTTPPVDAFLMQPPER